VILHNRCIYDIYHNAMHESEVAAKWQHLRQRLYNEWGCLMHPHEDEDAMLNACKWGWGKKIKSFSDGSKGLQLAGLAAIVMTGSTFLYFCKTNHTNIIKLHSISDCVCEGFPSIKTLLRYYFYRRMADCR